MQKDTKRNLFVAATYGAVLLLGLLLGQNYADDNRQSGTSTLLPLGLGHTGKVQRMIDLIESNYVDSVEVSRLQDLAIGEIVAQLDPYSEYLYPQAALRQRQALEGSFEGIGIEYYKVNDTLITVGLIAGGPAQQAGLRVGDRLIAINGDTIAGVNITEKAIDEKIRGRLGTPVTILVSRNGQALPQPINITRKRVEVSSVDAAYIIDSAMAYIKISRFGAKTAEDFTQALAQLKKAGAKRLIVDLRENGGGYFDAATALASQFFNDKELLVYTEGAHEPRTDYYSTADGLFGTGALAVLIDEQSASASEIVAGAVQDLERGIIVGRRSFGKGLVQEQFGFGDGSALNLTVARYYTPSGRCIQKTYPKNHAILKSPTLETATVVGTEQSESSGWQEPQSRHPQRANRPVLTGGGIAPDVWTPVNGLDTSAWYKRIRRGNLIEEYVYGYLAKSVPAYSVENFLEKYNLPDWAYSDFLTYVKTRGITYSAHEARAGKPRICTDMEALLGRFYFGSEAFFRVRNRSDETLAIAINALSGE
ncbi:S41 family peptidase [Parapedobacter lycopersici]|uniref:S41 family peptidase n=1 Tax=Parapedobacter lycopersici TaxID=1864939 RepID=UPI00214D6E5E|nr:S41 family peptidase [Parapedobacter lycopersici]